ncbi:ESCRT-0 subunit protein hse1 [Blastomyces dermatitidis]|uniref:Class E vacuolar protein-sorting machinery protein HSE1 n=1 Tax=Blastomyces gilchristii (strain SLH14081) TaxID=559298 RepID=A0A179UK10_BLAGS|nr:signal transducing adaptor molecule [Blastomyces gilchristii SLH14081]OAT08375.1 signal transducing adaptor molecule [Blastomyces gilchristii SLH14081]
MFRAQQNAFDDAVAKATDENLTSENWEFILDVCDKVGSEDTGAKDAVAAMIKRLAHRNANVQLYTLELANALSQNCGVNMHRELASRSFTDSLLRLANDRNTHQQVKAKILERMEEWTEMFSSNPDFGIMEQAYMKLKSQNPNLQPPSKPTKRQITDFDRQKEEEELQMALALSIKDKSSSSSTHNNTAAQRTTSQDSQGQPAPSQLLPSGTTAATVSRVRALYDFQPSEPGELQFRKGDVIAVLESVYKDWWKGSLRGQTGIFPLNYVEKLSDPTQEELQREAQMEAEVFAEIKNVEKLLTLLSTSSSELNVQENDEITTLYHSTLAIRPKLIELIGKYSQKKDDFTQLNEKFIKARRDYESLLEASMAHPSQPHYGRPPQSAYSYPVQSASPGYPQGVQQDEAHHYYAAHPQDGPKPFQSSQTPFYSSEQVPLPYPNNVQTPDTRQRTPSGTRPLQQSQQQPPSDTYGANGLVHNHAQNSSDHPQELGTSVYDSPQDSVPPNIRHSYHSPSHQPSHQVQPQPADFSSLPYSPVGNPQSQTPSLNQPYTAQSHPPQHIQQHQQLATSAPSQPHQAPPSVPSSSPGQPPYPTAPAAARPGPGSGSYQSYHPPSGPQATSSNVNLNPSSFYR